MTEKKELNEEELKSINGGTGSKKGGKQMKYFCQYCSDAFAIRRELENHIKKAHPGQPIVF